jgi:hypothetical protein
VDILSETEYPEHNPQYDRSEHADEKVIALHMDTPPETLARWRVEKLDPKAK